MTLTEVIFCHDAGELAKESDDKLLAIRAGIEEELLAVPPHMDSVFGQYLVEKYKEIVLSITQLLNKRYGCND
ncbi:hypothetical protein ACFPMF_27610 [Larkinella bovis]|uniref:Uncharacterized protein n=1 Tax=Larkinella bovis TaxID=683041 RepID=A0ABW0IL85_9BACT